MLLDASAPSPPTPLPGRERGDAGAALPGRERGDSGVEIPLQTETLARWPDGSIRWLLLDFQIDLAAREKKSLTLRYGPEIRRAPVPNPVRVTKHGDGKVVIEPGPVRLVYDPKRFIPHGEAWVTDPSGGQQSDVRVRRTLARRWRVLNG